MQECKQEKSQIKRNISLYLQEKGVSDYEFYKKSGITRGILSQPNGISEENIARFLAYAPDVNIGWLITGRGTMLSDHSNPIRPEDVATDPAKGVGYTPATLPTGIASTTNGKVDAAHEPDPSAGQSVAIPTSSPQEGIPLIPLEAMAGALTSEQTVLEYECERYIVPAFKGADFLITVCGTSMIPTYYPGDIVACKRVPMSDLFFQWNKVYVIDTTQGPLIKRIKPGGDNEHVLIVSDNEKYDPFELPYPTIRSVALVIGVIRLE